MGFVPTKMKVKSVAFEQDTLIPARFTGEGEDVSPALSWENPPGGTREFAVICHDPDAPLVSPSGNYGFVHWVLYNIPADVTGLKEGTQLYTNGITDYGKTGYNGPMPPKGHGLHNYYFWVLALDKVMALEPGLTLWQFLEKAEPHLIGMNRLMGRYKRD